MAFVSQRVSAELKKKVDDIQQENKPWLIIHGAKKDADTEGAGLKRTVDRENPNT